MLNVHGKNANQKNFNIRYIIMVGCLPCAAAGPPGIAVAAVGTVGYGVYKYAKPKKKIKKKKVTKKKSKKGGSTNISDEHLDKIYYFSKKYTKNLIDSLRLSGHRYERRRDIASTLKRTIKNFLVNHIEPRFNPQQIERYLDLLNEYCDNNTEPVTKDIVKDYLQEALSVKEALSVNGGKGSKKFKRNEIVRFKSKTGKNMDMKFARYLDKNMATLKFVNKNKKGTINVNLDRIEKMPKRIANTKLRQKTRRANLVRKKRGIKSKSKSSTLSLPSSEKDVNDLLKDLKL